MGHAPNQFTGQGQGQGQEQERGQDLGALPQTPRFFKKNLVKLLLKD